MTATDPVPKTAGPIPGDPEMASAILMQCYEMQAPAEALLRAFLAERDGDHARVRFWLAAYEQVVERSGEGT
jgi:hypothetical protein